MSDTPNWSTGYAGTFGYFSFYNNKMYFPNNNNILETNLDDGTHTVWASPPGSYCYGSIVYGDSLYSTDGLGNVYKISLATKSIELFVELYYAQAIVEYGGFFYIANYNGGQISKIKISDPNNSSVSNKDWAVTGSPQTSSLAITSEYLYVGFNEENNRYICRIKLSDATVNSTWAQLPSGFPDGLVVHNGFLYASNEATSDDTNTIYRITLSDTPEVTVWKTGIVKQTRGLGYNDGYIYSYSANSGIIGKYYLDTPSPPGPPPSPPCFKEDTEILTDQGYRLIQDLRKGDLIKTLRNDYKPIAMIGKRQMQHDMVEERVKTQLYKCSPAEYPEITKDLVITGCHSILVDAFVSEEQKAKTLEVNGKIFITDVKYRLPACADERASVYEIPGEYTIYHLALEHEDYYMNYGIYANGLLVETCSKRYLKELSNMDLIE